MKLSAPIFELKRRARRMARDENLPLHEALDRMARAEGFARWSLLSSQLATDSPSRTLLSRLSEGDLLLLGARPGHGKTLMALQLLLDAARLGTRAVFFTLEYSERETKDRIRALEKGETGLGDRLDIVASDDISAATIVGNLSHSPRGTVAVVDYLQILDQQRSKPPLAEQMLVLQNFARINGHILGFISQIDRSFDPNREPVPGVADIRLPNPIELNVFSKACFLHDGEMRLLEVA